jgi:hypothetical protein
MKGDRVVKRWRIALFAGLALACSAAVRADSIVSGSFGGTCDGGCFTGYYASTSPTGTFSYDRSTQDLSLTISWDGLTFGFSGLPQADYLALSGHGPSSLNYFAYCFASALFPPPQYTCDNGSGLALWLVGKDGPGPAIDATPENPYGPQSYPYDEATGVLAGIGKPHANVDPVATPEPGTIVLGGSALLLLIAKSLRRF